MGPHSPLSPLQKNFSAQWLMDECGFNGTAAMESPRQTSDSVSTAVQNDDGHGGHRIVPTAPLSQSKEEDRSTCERRGNKFIRGERHRSLFHNKSCFTENQELKTPCFSDSLTPPNLLADSPVCFSAKCISPILLLSPLKKPSGVDLSMYLPENYTPAATEVLESSFDGGMFQFPAVSVRESPSFEMDVDTREGKHERENQFTTNIVGRSVLTEAAPRPLSRAASTEMELGNSLGRTEIEFSRLFSDYSSRWGSTDSTDDVSMDYESSDEDIGNAMRAKSHARFEKIHCTQSQWPLSFTAENLEEFPPKKIIKEADRDREMSVSVRNKLERERRKTMNTKLEKLRQSIPQVAQNKRASKAKILNKAAEYVKELSVTESTLFEQKAAEKARNEELVRRLVQLTSNM